jgi:hypothetical protein
MLVDAHVGILVDAHVGIWWIHFMDDIFWHIVNVHVNVKMTHYFLIMIDKVHK